MLWSHRERERDSCLTLSLKRRESECSAAGCRTYRTWRNQKLPARIRDVGAMQCRFGVFTNSAARSGCAQGVKRCVGSVQNDLHHCLTVCLTRSPYQTNDCTLGVFVTRDCAGLSMSHNDRLPSRSLCTGRYECRFFRKIACCDRIFQVTSGLGRRRPPVPEKTKSDEETIKQANQTAPVDHPCR
jgi:hypothetical protein